MGKIKPKHLMFLYETVARIVSGALKQEGTLRSLVFEHAKKFIKTHLVLAIEVTRHRGLLEKLISETKLVEHEDLDPVLAQVLVFDLLLGKQQEFPSGHDILDRVSKYRMKLEDVLHKLKETGKFDKLVISKPEATLPRYGRVNTLIASLESVVSSLQSCGFQLLDTEGKSYQEFLDCVRSLQPNEFVIDFHFPQDLLVFNPSQYLGKLFVCRAGHLILHDKTSYFPVACLGAPPGSTVLDACAAPGMKTAHIAARMKNEGIIYAFDTHMDRLNTLQTMMSYSGVTCCKWKCIDFTQVIPQKPQYSSVEYLLLDPPCSGSGMVNRLDSLTDNTESKYIGRVKSLSGLQFKLLCHAAKFPNVKRIVYSTCTIEVQENEQVIKDFVDKNPGKFRVVNALPEWPTRGDSNFDFGKLCVRSTPEKDLTNGFFVAVLDKISEISVPITRKFKDEKPDKVSEKEHESMPEQKHPKQKRIYVRKRVKRGKRERERERQGGGLKDVKITESTEVKSLQVNKSETTTNLAKKHKKKKNCEQATEFYATEENREGKASKRKWELMEGTSEQACKDTQFESKPKKHKLSQSLKHISESKSEEANYQVSNESRKKSKKKKRKLDKNFDNVEHGFVKQEFCDTQTDDNLELLGSNSEQVVKKQKHKKRRLSEENADTKKSFADDKQELSRNSGELIF